MQHIPLSYASQETFRAPASRRFAAGLVDLLTLVGIETPLALWRYVAAWAGQYSTVSLTLSLLFIAAFSVVDTFGISPGKRVMGLAVDVADLRSYAVRWVLKWWWLIASPVLLDPTGSVFWTYGTTPPDWVNLTTSAVTLSCIIVWLLADLCPLAGARRQFLHDRLSHSVVRFSNV